MFADREGSNQTAWMGRLIWALAVCICPKRCFHMAWPIYDLKFLLFLNVETELLWKLKEKKSPIQKFIEVKL